MKKIVPMSNSLLMINAISPYPYDHTETHKLSIVNKQTSKLVYTFN